jgi:hypothetical protein
MPQHSNTQRSAQPIKIPLRSSFHPALLSRTALKAP